LKKQQQFLKKKSTNILNCSLKTLNKLEKAEAKEKKEKEVQKYTAVSSAILAKPSWLELLSEKQL
jgi:hypothetical protein